MRGVLRLIGHSELGTLGTPGETSATDFLFFNGQEYAPVRVAPEV